MNVVVILAMTIFCLALPLEAGHKWERRQVERLQFSEEMEADGFIQSVTIPVSEEMDRRLEIDYPNEEEVISYRVSKRQSSFDRKIFLLKIKSVERESREESYIHVMVRDAIYTFELLAVKWVCEEDELVPFVEDYES